MNSKLTVKLITYNRSEKLHNALEAWGRSAFRGISIEVLDNASTDGTAKVVYDAQRENARISYFRHESNIGVVGNLLRAYERFDSEYCWVLCDDDDFDSSACESIILAMEKNVDTIVVGSVAVEPNDVGFEGMVSDYVARGAAFFVQASFLPNLIFKRKYLTGDVLYRLYRASACIYPHAVLAGVLVETAKTLKVIDRPFVKRIHNDDVRPLGLHWLYESMLPSRYLHGNSKELWVGQMLSFTRNRSVVALIKNQIWERAHYAFSFEQAVVLFGILKPYYPIHAFSLLILAITPPVILSLALSLVGRPVEKRVIDINSKRY